MKIADVMSPYPITVAPDASPDEAEELLERHRMRHLPVMEGERIVGVLSDRDLLSATGFLPARVFAAARAGASPPASVREVMTSPPVTATPDLPVVSASLEMTLRALGCLPVVDAGELKGIVTETDLLRAFVRMIEAGGVAGDVDPSLSQLMTKDPRCLEAGAHLSTALELCGEQKFRHIPVVRRSGELIGIVSDRDLRRAVGCGREGDWPVSEMMSLDPVHVTRFEPVSLAAERMIVNHISALPVVDDGTVVGIVTVTDLLDHFLESLREPDAAG
jgi:CBS domain-containing protein